MKKFLLPAILFILLINRLSFSQWSTNPNNTLVIGYGVNPEICSDSAGGCYVTYEVGSPAELYLHRVNKYGYQPWGDKRIITGELDEQHNAKIIEDGESGIIVSYGDRIMYGTYRLRVQKVDSTGNLLWGSNGQRVSLTDTSQSVQRIVSDGNGGCVVVWMEPDYLGNSEYRINRIDRYGQRIWGDNGIYIQSDYNSDPSRLINAFDGNYYLEIRENIYRIRQNGEFTLWESTPDWGLILAAPDGGGILHSSIWNPYFYNLLAQRKGSLGNNLWQEPYVNVTDSIDINSPLRIQYNQGNFYYGWEGRKNGIDQVAQFQALKLDGTKLYPDGSISIGELPSGAPSLCPSNESGITVIWNSPIIPDNSTLAQTFDTLGNKVWNEEGIVVAHPSIDHQGLTTNGYGGFIIGGLINDITIVLQEVSRNGNLGEVIIPVELISFIGEVVNNKIKLSWITATETNNRGFEVERLQDYKIAKLQDWERVGFVEGNGTTTETKSYSFIDKIISDGKIYYRLKQIDYYGTYKVYGPVEVNIRLPLTFSLAQNYPNPFNPITNIEYRIPNKEFVTLMVYDVLGNEVAALVNEEKPAGTYSVRFKGSNLPSGVYIYKISAGYNTAVKKLILLK